MAKENALVVGPPKLAAFMEKAFTVYQANTPDDADEGLRSQDIPQDCEIVIVSATDKMVDDGRGSMENMVARYAPAACVCIFVPNEADQVTIRDRILEKVRANNLVEAPFYFFGKKSPLIAVKNAKEAWDQWNEGYQEAENDAIAEASQVANLAKRQGSKIITVTSPKGGSGKSTTAILLAAEIALSTMAAGNPKRVCVVDMDVFEGQLGFMIGQPEPTVITLLKSITGVDEVDYSPANLKNIAVEKPLMKANNSPSGAKLDFYLAAKLGAASLAVPDTFYYKLILALTHMYDFVIIDTSTNYITDNRIRNVAYALADSICFVTTPADQALLGMTRWFYYVARGTEVGAMGIPREKIGIILNHAPANIADEVKNVTMHANPEWDGQSESGVNIIAAIPDTPMRLFTEVGRAKFLEKLLYDKEYGIGKAFYRLARNVVPKNVNMRPIADFNNGQKKKSHPAPAPQEEPRREEEAPPEKKGFFAKIFGKK